MSLQRLLFGAVLAAILAGGCSDGDSEPAAEKSCSPACGPCEICDETTLECKSACGADTTCEHGACVPVQAAGCSPACDPCEVCDTSAAPKCVSLCGQGATCDTAKQQCVPLACEPPCAAGSACEMGTCKPVAAVQCTPACGKCEACDTSGTIPKCVDLCGAGATCDDSASQCIAIDTFHENAPALQGPFASGYQVTAACVTCHPSAAQEFMATIHWKWKGPTPQLVSATDLKTVLNPGNIGKATLINNFCVGVASNEKRCDQCHAGYGGDPDGTKPQKSARAYAAYNPADSTSDSSIPLANRVDCLVCHADPATGYAKDPKNFGNPLPTLDLSKIAKRLVKPTRANCGSCHFYAGGGDNVKLMGSSLKDPGKDADVHMGKGMTCADCHAMPGHKFKGAGVHTPANDGRAACSDCHGMTPHAKLGDGKQLDDHVTRVACQTCHIPAFSRTQFAKMDWDWSTAGDNGKGSAGVVTTKVNEAGQPDPNGTPVTTYDYMKGSFVWKRNVRPAYAWYNGQMTHQLIGDKADFTQLGLDPNDDSKRINLGMPVGSLADPKAKIHPFKLFRGRQAVYVDGASSFVVNPNVFGPGSLWAVVQAPGYSYDSTAMQGLWSTALTKGAQLAGQVSSSTTLSPFDSTSGKGWAFRYTKLYMDLNHEVSPKAKALGANGTCSDCHSATPKVPVCELYAGASKKPWGCP